MLKIIFFASAILFFFAVYFHNIIELDQDLGRHLLTGKIILETHQVPNINLFSYTQTNFPFINSHWLSEVIFSLLGLTRLVYFKTVVMLTVGILTLYTTYKFSKNLTATAIAFAIFAPVLLERTEIRPEIFSYLFIAIFIYILLLKPKLIWVLPIIEILWVNAHIYFILGPILITIYCLASKRITPYAVLIFAATLCNPYGLSGAIYPLRVFDNYGYSIVENQNIFFLREMIFNPNIFYFGIAVTIFLASFFFVRFRLSAIGYLLSVLVILPIIHIRSFPLLFLIELPIFAFNLAGWKKYGTTVVAGVILLTVFRTYRLASNQYYLSIDSQKKFGTDVSESGKGAVDFAITNKLPGPIFNNFDIGSYLDYRLYPKYKVFVDGRPEAYPKEFFQNLYIPMQQSPENFSKVDDIYKFNLIIFSHTDGTPWGQQFLTDIVKNKKFALVYIDDYAVVFVRDERLWKPFSWDKFTKDHYEKLFALNPDSPAALQGLGTIYSQNPTTTVLGEQLLVKYRQKVSLILF